MAIYLIKNIKSITINNIIIIINSIICKYNNLKRCLFTKKKQLIIIHYKNITIINICD